MPHFTLLANNLHFDYNEKTKIFENHSLKLEVPRGQTNKLYGIIGPSGSGKTTLLSILCGQLKPSGGQILINDTDIYAIDDLKRRQIIALQMQTATSLRGKLKYNILFGLPEGLEESQPIYSDEFLIEVLQKVGLWQLFEPKDGLDTLIGEGGLNLSGGQRQRLNFAGLFLRVQYFKPQIVLIDEPTSSLDEISEQEITKMMLQISQNSVTIVIAHRLKTLEDSIAILDCSMLDNTKEMHFLSKAELLKKSIYYQKLMNGEETLEE